MKNKIKTMELETLRDILQLISEGTNTLYLMQKKKNNKTCLKYLKHAKQSGLITQNKQGLTRPYALTERGRQLLNLLLE